LQSVEKWATRSDAWTPDDDTRLANIVLLHIQTGSTQLRAFEQAANELGRTAAACGYRWNGVVRRNYRGEIEEAKMQRKQAQKTTTLTDVNSESESLALASNYVVHTEHASSSQSMKEVLHFLQTYDTQYQKLLGQIQQLEQENRDLQERLSSFIPVPVPLEPTIEVVEDTVTPEQLEEDSRTLFAIMERARKLLGRVDT
jgi:prespore-specific regulator